MCLMAIWNSSSVITYLYIWSIFLFALTLLFLIFFSFLCKCLPWCLAPNRCSVELVISVVTMRAQQSSYAIACSISQLSLSKTELWNPTPMSSSPRLPYLHSTSSSSPILRVIPDLDSSLSLSFMSNLSANSAGSASNRF